eukprot:1160012-Pelagomonas_calceolata.AAC.9
MPQLNAALIPHRTQPQKNSFPFPCTASATQGPQVVVLWDLDYDAKVACTNGSVEMNARHLGQEQSPQALHLGCDSAGTDAHLVFVMEGQSPQARHLGNDQGMEIFKAGLRAGKTCGGEGSYDS